MKILLVNYRYFISGGPEKYMFNIKKKLEEEGHEVIPFSVKSNKNEKTEYEKYFVEPIGSKDAVYYEDYKKTPKTILQMLSRSIYSFSTKKAIKKIIKDTNPDIVYILHFINKLSPSVIKGAKEMKKPVVVRLSDYFLLCPKFDFLYKGAICEECLKNGYRPCIKKKCVKNSLFASIIRVFSMKVHKFIKVYKNIDTIITPSNYLKVKLQENGFEKNNICHVPTFCREKDANIENIGTYGLYFGRISEEKGVEYVIKAYETLDEKYKLKIMGDDTTEEAKRLKKYVQEKNIKNVEFLGFKKGEELETVIKNARFVLVPSIWYENLPNTILEGFSYGKPVLATNIGSLTETIKDGINGYLFEIGNSKQIADCILKLDDDNLVKQIGRNNIECIKNEYSIEKHYQKLIEIFETVKEENEKNGR